MKKIYKDCSLCCNKRFLKFIVFKNFRVFLSVFILSCFVTNAFAQTNITVSFKDEKLEKAIQQIEKQSGFKFVYRQGLLDNLTVEGFEARNRPLGEVLKAVLDPHELTYTVSGKNVVIRKKDEVRTEGRSSTVKITGRIYDEANQQPLPGAAVVDPLTNRGITTAGDGSFSLDLPGTSDIISVSYLGYESQIVIVEAGKPVMVYLSEMPSEMEDVVVVGYGSTRRKDFTGSVATVKVEEIAYTPSLSVDDALAGKAAGVSVIKADGSPGGAVRIKVRGGTSLLGGTDPLYIIDGIPTEVTNNYISTTEIVNPMEASNYGESFNSSISGSFARGLNNISGLNINDIETIDILKDASATAIYGSKAANGVVIITTKRGRRDTKPVLSFNYYVGVSTPKTEKVLNSEQYLGLLKESAERTVRYIENTASKLSGDRQNNYNLYSASTLGSAQRLLRALEDENRDYIGVPGTNTDWVDLITKTGIVQNADVSVSGGGTSSRYYTSMAYTKQEGTLLNTDFERFSSTVNIDSDITSWARLYTNVNLSYTKNDITNGVYGQAMYAPPVFPVYNDDGTFGDIGNLGTSYMGYQNPMAVATTTNEAKTYSMKGSMALEVDLYKGLKFRSTVSADYIDYNQRNYVPSYLRIGGFYGIQDSGGGVGTMANSKAMNTFIENNFSYVKEFNDHHRMDALLGTAWESNRMDYFAASGEGYPDDKFLNNLSSAATPTKVEGATPWKKSSLLSFYVRLNYIYKEKYLFTFTGRSDASSKFSPDNRVGYFPSGAVAWRIGEENFLRDAAWINEIKLRVSMGKTGTQNIKDHMWRTLYGVGSYAGASTLHPIQLGNDEIKWESTTQKDLGLDYGFFSNRLRGTLAWYEKVTDGALLNITPAPSACLNTVIYNIAKIRNRGIEFDITGEFIRGRNWRWEGSLNISKNKSKVLNIAGDTFSDPDDRDNLNLGTSVVMEGEPLGLFYGRLTDGIFKNDGEIMAYIESAPSDFYWMIFSPAMGPGAERFVMDENGSFKQGVLGNANPKFYGGYTNTLSYKGLTLQTLFTFSYGNEMMFQADVADKSLSSLANRGVRVLKGWSETNTNTNRPTSLYGTTNFLTSANIYDASYLKLKSLTLSYTFPARISEKMAMTNLTVYTSMSNVFTITKYPGLDPEVSDDPSSIIGGGRDINSYPTVRTFNFGIRMTF